VRYVLADSLVFCVYLIGMLIIVWVAVTAPQGSPIMNTLVNIVGWSLNVGIVPVVLVVNWWMTCSADSIRRILRAIVVSVVGFAIASCPISVVLMLFYNAIGGKH